VAEDLDDHRRIFDACPERVEGAAMIFKAPPQLGQCSTAISSFLNTSGSEPRRRPVLDPDGMSEIDCSYHDRSP